jgi:phosphatidylglycerophosphate synthase
VDKVLVCGAFILFAGPGFVSIDGEHVTDVRAWMVVVIVGRELLVTGLRGFSESAGHSFGASLHGKMKMWVQSITVPAILLIVAHEQTWASGSWAVWTKKALVWLTVVVTALSTIQYLIRSRRILEESAAS